MSETHVEEWTGDLIGRHMNGDRVRVHMSRFHGLVLTAGRTYLGDEGYREVCAYLHDPQALVDWLADQGYTPTIPPRETKRADPPVVPEKSEPEETTT